MSFDFQSARQMTSRYDGKCVLCADPIVVGDQIYWNGTLRQAAHARHDEAHGKLPGYVVTSAPFNLALLDVPIRVHEIKSKFEGGRWVVVATEIIFEGVARNPQFAEAVGKRVAKRNEQGFRMQEDAGIRPPVLAKQIGETSNGFRSEIFYEQTGGWTIQDNPWFAAHVSGEIAFSGRRMAREIVEAEFRQAGAETPMPCGACDQLTWFKPTVGTFVCPGCGAVGHPDVVEGNRKARDEAAVEARQVETDPDFQAWVTEVANVQRDPFNDGECASPSHPAGCGCDLATAHNHGVPRGSGPAVAGLGRVAPEGGLSADAKARIVEATKAGDLRARRKAGRAAPGIGVLPARIDQTGSPHPTSVPASPESGSGSATKLLVDEGRFTVVFGEGERDYRTIRVSKNDNKEFFEGKGWKLAFLAGPDNDGDYLSFGLLLETGEIKVWKKFSAEKAEEFRSAVRVVLGDPAAAAEAYALKSSKCARCGRTLTVPASLHRGLGPECATKVSW